MPPRKKKAAAPSGLTVAQMTEGKPPANVAELAEQVETDGGAVLATYRDPFAGAWLLLCALPIAKVEPTPYQRELSETHAARLAGVIPKVGRFLDPLVLTRHAEGYWTPNGMHRLTAMKRLGAQSIVGLLVPEPEIAFRILALNTEKAHNLKDKSLEVIRMARGLAEDELTSDRPESDWAFEFEEPAYLTIGLCYEENGRFAGGSYLPVVKRCEEFSTEALSESLPERQAHAKLLLELDAEVGKVVQKLKDAGFQSPYLKPFVIARVNPLRFQKPAKPGQKAPRAQFEPTIQKMIDSAKKIDPTKIKPQDVARTGGSASED
jgi:ParB family transcriptional regulator, chromosome partitioning protein